MANSSKFYLVLAISLLIVLNVVEFVAADGALSRARSHVRKKKEPRQESTEQDARETPNVIQEVRNVVRQDDRHSDRHAGQGKQSRRKHRRRSRPRPTAFLSFAQSQPVIVEQYFVESAPEPVFVPSRFVEPDVASPVRTPAPIVVQSTSRPACEPAAIRYEPVDWFEAWNLRATATAGSDFEDISQFSIAFLLQANGGLGFDTSVKTLRESGMDFRDNLWLGDVNLVYEAVSSSFVRGRIGGGLNWLGDQYGGEAGVNLTAGFDLRLTNHWTLSGEGDVGTLGDADFLHTQLSLGRRIGDATVVLGFDHTDINGVEIESLFTGLQFHF